MEQGIPVGLVEQRTEEAVANYLKSWGDEVRSPNNRSEYRPVETLSKSDPKINATSDSSGG